MLRYRTSFGGSGSFLRVVQQHERRLDAQTRPSVADSVESADAASASQSRPSHDVPRFQGTGCRHMKAAPIAQPPDRAASRTAWLKPFAEIVPAQLGTACQPPAAAAADVTVISPGAVNKNAWQQAAAADRVHVAYSGRPVAQGAVVREHAPAARRSSSGRRKRRADVRLSIAQDRTWSRAAGVTRRQPAQRYRLATGAPVEQWRYSRAWYFLKPEIIQWKCHGR